MLSHLRLVHPRLLDGIVFHLSNESLATLKKSCRDLNTFLEEESHNYWRRVLASKIVRQRLQEFGEAWSKIGRHADVHLMKFLAQSYDRFLSGSPTRTPHCNWHPLFIGADTGSVDVCRKIVDITGDKNIKRSGDEISPLLIASQQGHFHVCEYLGGLLENKNPGDAENWTPLHSAAQNGHRDVCQYLLANIKGDLNPADNDGWRPLHLAAMNGHTSTVQTIMEHLTYGDSENHPIPLDLAAAEYTLKFVNK